VLETHAAAFTHRSGCEQFGDIDRLDTLRPRFEVAEHLPHALLRGQGEPDAIAPSHSDTWRS
jgi:hypothetical protein